MVQCQLCGFSYSYISNTHLKSSHNMTSYEYFLRFPGATVREFSEETRKRMSDSQTGNTNKLGTTVSEEGRHNLSEAAKLLLSDPVRAKWWSEINLGRVASEEHRRKNSEAQKGNTRALGNIIIRDSDYRRKLSERMSGRVVSEESRELNRLAHLGRTHSLETRELISNNSKAFWKDPEFVKKTRESQNRSNHLSPNLSEAVLGIILEENFPGLFRFTGGGGFSLGRRLPDYVCESQRLVIEYFGSYWHGLEEEGSRVLEYRSLGWSCLVIWDFDFWVDSREILVGRLKEFISSSSLVLV